MNRNSGRGSSRSQSRNQSNSRKSFSNSKSFSKNNTNSNQAKFSKNSNNSNRSNNSNSSNNSNKPYNKFSEDRKNSYPNNNNSNSSNSSNKPYNKFSEDRKNSYPNNSNYNNNNKNNWNSTGNPNRIKRVIKKNNIENQTSQEGIRLNKYIANSGLCSRREADLFIQNGVVEVNGKTITELGYRVKEGDSVFFDGRYIRPEKKTYVLLNKPKGYISTTRDEKARKTVMDLITDASPYRLFPVGRLDRQTTGLLLLTNDGDLAKKLTHPSHQVTKIYHVVLDKKVSIEDFDQLIKGLHFEEGLAKADKITYIENKPKNEVGIEIHIGWNRIVRRMFERLGYSVERLDRVSFAGLTKKNLKRGYWRILTEQEVNLLKMN